MEWDHSLVPALTKVNFPLHIISPSNWESLMELISTQGATDKSDHATTG
jgi:hypothetical protein